MLGCTQSRIGNSEIPVRLLRREQAIDHFHGGIVKLRIPESIGGQDGCLDDRMLGDMGLTRSDVDVETTKPFWRA